MHLGYNTNGFAHHTLEDCLSILQQLGYTAVALTPDVHHLNPHSPTWQNDVEALGERLKQMNFRCVLESGARFILDPWHKHQPTLLSPTAEARRRRRQFLRQLALAAEPLGCDVVSFWSGTPTDDAPVEVLLQRLVDEIRRLLDDIPMSVKLAFEPEPGMFIERMDQFAELLNRVQHPRFGLTLDVGHLICLGEAPVSAQIIRWQPWLWNVHLDDMKPGVHDHLKFGEGDLNLREVLASLQQIRFAGMASVELSRHSHDAVRTAQQSREQLRLNGA